MEVDDVSKPWLKEHLRGYTKHKLVNKFKQLEYE